MIVQPWGAYGGLLLMDIIDLPKYQEVEFISLEHDTWQVHDLEVDEAELHHGGRSSPISRMRSGRVHFGGDMSLVIRGVTDHVGRYAISDVGGAPYRGPYNHYYLLDPPPVVVKPPFVEKAPALSAALPDIDRLKYFNSAVGNSESGVVTKAYARQAKYRTAHEVSKTWTWPDGNVQGQVYRHNRASYQSAEFMRLEFLPKIDARQGLLTGIDFVESDYTYLGVKYFTGLTVAILRSWDADALQKAITAGTVSISVMGQVVTR